MTDVEENNIDVNDFEESGADASRRSRVTNSTLTQPRDLLRDTKQVDPLRPDLIFRHFWAMEQLQLPRWDLVVSF